MDGENMKTLLNQKLFRRHTIGRHLQCKSQQTGFYKVPTDFKL